MTGLVAISYILYLQCITVYGDSFTTVVPLNIGSHNTTKSALRYGFQRTSECQHFEKAFLCIQKCLDLNFDVAYADKNCKCTCYVKKEKAKYTMKYNSTRTKWKLGAPTTSIPAWAQDKKKKKEKDPDELVDVDETDLPFDSNPTELNNVTVEVSTVKTNVTPLNENANATAKGPEAAVTSGTQLTTDSAKGGGVKGNETSTATAIVGNVTSGTTGKGAVVTAAGAATTAVVVGSNATSAGNKTQTTVAA